MEKYMNVTGESEITHYELGDEYIRIHYKKSIVEYNTSIIAQQHIDAMKLLAQRGKGLSRYIDRNLYNRNTKKRSAEKTSVLRGLLGSLISFK